MDPHFNLLEGKSFWMVNHGKNSELIVRLRLANFIAYRLRFLQFASDSNKYSIE